MLDVTKNQLFGPVSVSIGGVDVGHTDDAGVKCNFKQTIVYAMAGKYGKVPVNAWLNGQDMEIEFNLIQTVKADLSAVLPGATLVTNLAGEQKLTFGRGAGFKLTGVAVVLAPFPASMAPQFNFSIVRAVPIGDFDLVYTGDAFNLWKCKFKALINEAGGAEGSFLWTFGDPAVTADPVAPAVSAVSPIDGAVGVAVGANVVATITKDLDGNTVNAGSVHLISDPGGAALPVDGTVTLANNGVLTTITFDPTPPLAGTTQHLFIIEGGTPNGVKGLNGVDIGFFGSTFTTV
jgi:hypothetical protein